MCLWIFINFLIQSYVSPASYGGEIAGSRDSFLYCERERIDYNILYLFAGKGFNGFFFNLSYFSSVIFCIIIQSYAYI